MTIEVPLWLQGGTYAARLDRLSIDLMYDEGVIDLSCFKVAQRAAGANFTVDVSVGEAIVTGDDQANQGKYSCRCTAIENAAIGAAPGSNSRIDIVGLRINDPNAGGNAGNSAAIIVTAGTVAASPVPPALPASTLLLAYVTIAAGQGSIQNANISDQRLMAGRRCAPATIEWTAATVAPNGWLLAAGQAISRTTYARLFSVIGTSYGVGDGTTTFNLPDLRGRTPVALDNMGGSDAGRLSVGNTLGATGGEEAHSLSTAELAVHNHGITDGGHFHGVDGHISGSPTGSRLQRLDTANITSGVTVVNTSVAGTGISVNNAGAGTAHNNMQPYILLNALIRT